MVSRPLRHGDACNRFQMKHGRITPQFNRQCSEICLKNPETKAEFSAIEWLLRVPSSSMNARPLCLAAGFSVFSGACASARTRTIAPRLCCPGETDVILLQLLCLGGKIAETDEARRPISTGARTAEADIVFAKHDIVNQMRWCLENATQSNSRKVNFCECGC